MFPLCPVLCTLISGKTCTSPLLIRLCTLKGVKQVLDFESCFCQAASEKRQSFGYCTFKKSGSLQTHLIIMHSKKTAGTFFHSWVPTVACNRKCKDSSLFFSRNMSKLQTEALRLPVKWRRLVQVQGRLYKPPASGRMLLLHPAPRASLRPFSLYDIRLCFKSTDRSKCPRQTSVYVFIPKSCQLGWAPWSRTVWSRFYIHLGEVFHYAACQSSPSVISLPNTCAGAGHWQVHFRGCCLSQEHFVNSGNSWGYRLVKTHWDSGWLSTRMSTPACRAAQD